MASRIGKVAEVWRRRAVACILGASVLLSARASQAANERKLENVKNPKLFASTVDGLDRSNSPLDAILLLKSGEWLLASGAQTFRSDDFPKPLAQDITAKTAAGKRVVPGDCDERGACVAIYDDWSASITQQVAPPGCFQSMLSRYKSKKYRLKDVEISGSGCVFLGEDGEATYSTGLDPELQGALWDRHLSRRPIESLVVAFDGSWALVAGHDPMYSGIPDSLKNVLEARAASDAHVAGALMLGPGNDFLWYSQQVDKVDKSTPIGAIEWDLPGSNNIWNRMKQNGVTGISIALITNTPSGHPLVTTTRGYGRRRADRQLPVLSTTPFALASLSKLFGGLAAAIMLENSNTALKPNEDLRKSNQLPAAGAFKRWQAEGEDKSSEFWRHLPSSIRKQALTEKLNAISLDRLMTHKNGVVSERDGSSMVRRGLWSQNDARSTLDWLRGRRCDEDQCTEFGNSVWQIVGDEDSHYDFEYDSADYLVLQAILEDRTGQNMHDFLKTKVFDRVGMPSATSRINLSPSYQQSLAWRHTAAGIVDSDMSSSAWIFGGGIRSSSVDYANAMIVLLDQGRAANGANILTAGSVNSHFLNPPAKVSVARGWGVDFNTAPTELSDAPFFHSGGQDGARTRMCGNPTDNEGIVVLTNGGKYADRLIDEIIAAYLGKVSWKSGATCK